jgi:two-component system, NarL family, nitrate/nitrite response regulator NarL
MSSKSHQRREALNAIGVVIAERTRMSGALLAKVLARNSRFNIVAAVLPSELLDTVRRVQPDLAIVSADTDAGPTKGIEVVRQMRALLPEVRVLVLSDSSDRNLVIHAFQAGAKGLFSRTESVDRLPKCIERVQHGEIWATNEHQRFLVEALVATSPFQVFDARGSELLSGRELEVVQYAAKGLTNRQIAQKLKLSEHTVKNYVFHAFNKLGVSNRVELLFYMFNQFGTSLQMIDLPLENNRSPIDELHNAAELGYASAQFVLGRKYLAGDRLEKDYDQAFFWLRLAEEGGKEISTESRTALNGLRASMTPAEIETQEKRVSLWLENHRVSPPKSKVRGIVRKLSDVAV